MLRFIAGFALGTMISTLGVSGTINYVDQLVNKAKESIPAPEQLRK
ncbi:hypothetical protein UFOVP116_54 [uncultured Caudovirales phage]|uniref:Uncharacterized protein n=1 Tax=uncultured Caudovirales phage TaxID=2100421 RepID=A0A6J5L5C3_9CAUD|nr:hypothetical protein UFOVP116_54 [uncultured Caudovirales phage]